MFRDQEPRARPCRAFSSAGEVWAVDKTVLAECGQAAGSLGWIVCHGMTLSCVGEKAIVTLLSCEEHASGISRHKKQNLILESGQGPTANVQPLNLLQSLYIRSLLRLIKRSSFTVDQ
jgi:hypothetical protein